MSFKKGLTYVVYSEKYKHWYMVHQISMKSWIATNFTNLDINPNHYQFRNNGVGLWEMLQPDKNYKCHTETKEFRKSMFDVLMYGHFKD